MRLRDWFKSKKAKAIAMLGCFAMLLGVGASVSVVSAVKESQVVETKADTKGGTLYIDVTNFGATSGIYAYFYGGSGSGARGWPGNSMTKVDSTNIWSVTVPEGYNYVIFNNNGSVRSSKDQAPGPLVIPEYLSRQNIWVPLTNTSGWDYVEGNASAGSWKYCVPKGANYYFIPSNKWIAAGTTYKFNQFHGNGWTPVTMTRAPAIASCGAAERTYSGISTTQAVYYVTTTKPIHTFQVLCFDGSTQKYASGSIEPSPDYKMVIIPRDCDWAETMVPNDASGTYWSSLDIFRKTTDVSLSKTTVRVFFCHKNTHWNSYQETVGVRAWGGDAAITVGPQAFEHTIYFMNWFQDNDGTNNMYYAYADIPNNVTGYDFVKLEKTADDDAYNNYNSKIHYSSENSFTLDSVAWIRYGRDSGNYLDTGGTYNMESGGKAGSNLLTHIFEARDTCSNSILNGYGDIGALTDNFYSHKADGAENASVTSLGGSSDKLSVHYSAMVSRNAGGSSAGIIPGPSRDQSPLTLTLWIVLGAGILGLGAIGTAYLVSKKKKRHQA